MSKQDFNLVNRMKKLYKNPCKALIAALVCQGILDSDSEYVMSPEFEEQCYMINLDPYVLRQNDNLRLFTEFVLTDDFMR